MWKRNWSHFWGNAERLTCDWQVIRGVVLHLLLCYLLIINGLRLDLSRVMTRCVLRHPAMTSAFSLQVYSGGKCYRLCAVLTTYKGWLNSRAWQHLLRQMFCTLRGMALVMSKKRKQCWVTCLLSSSWERVGLGIIALICLYQSPVLFTAHGD